jgi:hypothetical protein
LVRTLRVFENRVLKKIFGLKMDEIIGGWRKRHNEQLCNVFALLNIIRTIKSRTMRWAGRVARMGIRGVHGVFWWESQKEGPLEDSRRQEANIKRDLGETGGGALELSRISSWPAQDYLLPLYFSTPTPQI